MPQQRCLQVADLAGDERTFNGGSRVGIAVRSRSANSPATTAKAGMTPARPQTSRRASIPIGASRTSQATSSGWSGEPAEVEELAATHRRGH